MMSLRPRPVIASFTKETQVSRESSERVMKLTIILFGARMMS